MVKSTKAKSTKEKSYYTVLDGNLNDWLGSGAGEIPIYDSFESIQNHVVERAFETGINANAFVVYKLVALGKCKPIAVDFDFDTTDG
jgi:hypothetical protein